MPCCTECFIDLEAKGFILTQSTAFGTCDYCRSGDVPLIDPGELEDLFYHILNSYQNHPTALLSLGVDNPVRMHEHIVQFWPNLFSAILLDSGKVEALLIDIAGNLHVTNPNLFSDPVEMRRFLLTAELTGASLQENTWIKFAEEIKHTNRYFVTNALQLDELLVLIENHKKHYKPGKLFYRSRVCKELIPPHEMGKPPQHLARGGRANPAGIPYLYLAHEKLTTAYETRASLHDSLCVGTFEVIDDLKVISLRDIQDVSPIVCGSALEKYAVHRKYMLRLSQDLSRPVNRNDSEFDYLPTQYLCEFLKFSGFDAVEYQSSLYPTGTNITVFNDEKVTCTHSELHKVQDISYIFQPEIWGTGDPDVTLTV